MRTVGEYILGLAAIGGVLTTSLYGQQTAPEVRSDQLCNVALLRCDGAHAAALKTNTGIDFGAFTGMHYAGPESKQDRPSGGLWDSPFASAQVASYSSYLRRDRIRAPFLFVEEEDTLRSRGLEPMSVWAWNQQNSTTSQQDKKSSADQDSPKHIFLVVPAFHVAYQKTFKPLTRREKFDLWLEGTYDPRGLGLYAFEAATLEYSSTDGFCGYGKEEVDYLKCFAATEADANISSFFGDFLFPVIMHQDPRYFRLGQGSFGKRVGYAVSRVFVTHADSGRAVFFASSLSGTVIGAAASNLYYPVQDRGLSHTLSRMGLDLGNTALFNVAAEFWPDIKLRLSHAFGK